MNKLTLKILVHENSCNRWISQVLRGAVYEICDRLYSQHKFYSLHFNLMWFSFLNVTFHDLSLPRNNEVHFNSLLKMEFHSKSPNCGNPSVSLGFLWLFPSFQWLMRNFQILGFYSRCILGEKLHSNHWK